MDEDIKPWIDYEIESLEIVSEEITARIRLLPRDITIFDRVVYEVLGLEDQKPHETHNWMKEGF